MFIVKYYLAGAALFALAAIFAQSIFLQLASGWIALSLAMVSLAYFLKTPKIFRKKHDGHIPWYIRWMFVPFLLGAQIYNSWARKHDKVPPIQKIGDDLYLACRLFPSDVDELQKLGVQGILDVTAEFDGLDWTATGQELDYLNIPTLDHQSPKEQDLVEAINWIDNHRQNGKGVVVHCALGRGRSVLVMAAYLLSRHQDWSVEQALQKIQDTRSTARLNSYQMRKLVRLHKQGIFQKQKTLAVIANPVAGGGKWPTHKEDVLAYLSAHFKIRLFETTEEKNGKVLAEQAVKEGAQNLLACGGDGTITEVAHVASQAGIPLGIMPMGTANALAHALYGSKSKIIPVDVACDAVIGGKTRKIDTALCNDELMLLVSAIGFEQKMIEKADREQKDEGGQFAYVGALIEAVNDNDTCSIELTLDDDEAQKIETGSLVIANAAPFTTVLAQGGGEPNFADGKLDVTWLPKTDHPSEQMLNLLELTLSGVTNSSVSDQIIHRQATEVTISSDREIKYVVDGENRQSQQIKIRVQPGSLLVFESAEKT